MDETRQLYIISGCNGAGKTTASYTVLPEILLCKEFVNADEIAKGLSPFNPESMAIEAGRLMLKRIDELLATRTSFSIDSQISRRVNGSHVKCLFHWNPDFSYQLLDVSQYPASTSTDTAI